MEWEDENIELQYGWEYYDGWGCIGYVFCDLFEVLVYFFNIDWELNWGQGEFVFILVDYDNQFGVISCIFDVDCEFNNVLYDILEQVFLLSSNLIEVLLVSFIGLFIDFGYCEFVYECGDLLLEIVLIFFDVELVEIDVNGMEWCEVFCRGFCEIIL